MKPSKRLIFAAAIGSVLPVFCAAPARAQYRVDDGGHASDANNRIGSNGYNDASQVGPRAMGVSPSNIVYGNVTGLDYFHGSTGDSDPDINSAWTASAASDRLNAIAGPVNYAARSGTPQNTVYYNPVTLNTAPPSNFTATPGGAGIVPAPAISNQISDTRLGLVTSTPDQAASPLPGELDMVGPTDASGNAAALTLSPLYGIRDWRMDDPNDMYFLSRYSNVQFQSPGDASRLGNAAIAKMRQELNGTMVQGPNGQTPATAQPGQPNSNGVNSNGQINNTGTNGPANSTNLDQKAQTSAIANPQLNSNVANQSVNGTVNTGQGMQSQVINLPPPKEQSTTLADLENRRQKLESESKTKLTDAQAAQLFNQEQQYVSDVKKSEQPTAGLAGTTAKPPAPALAAAPVAPKAVATLPQKGMRMNPPAVVVKAPIAPTVPPVTPVLPAPVKPMTPVITAPPPQTPTEQPYIITSLASGIRSPSLAELLKDGEDQMREGKFNAALDTYDAAQEVAPNNPFITLGRSFAELGGTYYNRAATDLRRTITDEPAVLVGRYDLKGFLGADRLQFVTKDLGEIYQSEKQSTQAPLLLAFLAHNAGDDQKASDYLDALQQRAGGSSDTVVAAMRENWGIKAPGK